MFYLWSDISNFLKPWIRSGCPILYKTRCHPRSCKSHTTASRYCWFFKKHWVRIASNWLIICWFIWKLTGCLCSHFCFEILGACRLFCSAGPTISSNPSAPGLIGSSPLLLPFPYFSQVSHWGFSLGKRNLGLSFNFCMFDDPLTQIFRVF